MNAEAGRRQPPRKQIFLPRSSNNVLNFRVMRQPREHPAQLPGQLIVKLIVRQNKNSTL
jgi:hypothetical protein